MSSFPTSLYVHVPWCVKKCPYCDFNSHEFTALDTVSRRETEASYLGALLQDLRADLNTLDKPYNEERKALQTIFVGGGTPSLMSPGFYQELLDKVNSLVGIDGDAEITLEANPGTADAGNFKGYRKAGVNRLSIGAQSFSDQSLKALGRIHDSSQIPSAFAMARDAGINNINLDLMHGLPSQSIDLALEDLARAIDLAPEHISWYQLTIEKNTEFYSRPPILPAENTLDDIGSKGLALLSESGYQQYEISAYAKGGYKSRHNLNYWQFGNYLGIGAGAHGKLLVNGMLSRRWKQRMPLTYLEKSAYLEKNTCLERNSNLKREGLIAGENEISREDLPLEFFMNALRLVGGFSIDLFERQTGISFGDIEAKINCQIERGLLEQDNQMIRTTPLGRRFLDSVLADL